MGVVLQAVEGGHAYRLCEDGTGSLLVRGARSECRLGQTRRVCFAELQAAHRPTVDFGQAQPCRGVRYGGPPAGRRQVVA